ncbi:MAG: DUF3292 domain-containing protein [Deltaproteobacteria bacterium]|jgi:hypothetical protein|nr:DUF3292 domain-containing protein [Deltaproteobacteria bacterium]
MNKETELPLRVAREICQRLLERRVLSAAKLPDALSSIGAAAAGLLAGNGSHRALSLAADLTMRLIERGRLGNPGTAIEALTELNATLREILTKLPPGKAEAALKSAVDLALKLLETSATGSDPLALTLLRLAEASAALLPEPPNPKNKRQ